MNSSRKNRKSKRKDIAIPHSNDPNTSSHEMKNDDVAVCNTFVVENKCHTHCKVNYCNFMWTIDQYSEYHLRRSTCLKSSYFKAAGNDEYTWRLELSEPDQDKKVHICLYLHCDDTLGEEVLVKERMCVIDSKGEETNIRQSDKYENFEHEETRTYYLQLIDFLNGDDLLKENNSILMDGALTIFCEFHFISPASISTKCSNDKSAVLFNARDEHDFSQDIERLFGEEDFSDFTVTVGDEQFRVHRNILAARSPVFAAMLKHNMKEQNQNCLKITDMDRSVFKEMLRYIYTGKSSKLNEMAFDLLPAADKYDLKGLKIKCERHLVNKLSVENAADCLVLADLHGAALLRKQALQFIRFNAEAIKKKENWLKVAHSGVLLDDVFDTLFP
ncbi:speckle-type POZ protein B-like [Planococcus citri]|uniref:speckle-type POZ protein B-like n=1 Tax=Planococcus citri TaxID=170843 RepID=UPI0031F78D10